MIKHTNTIKGIALAVIISSGWIYSGQAQPQNDTTRQTVSLDGGFQSVPNESRPWVYWWWLKGNVTEQSITRDLEAMKQNGIGGLLMFDARGYHEDHVVPPLARMEFMSAEWR